MADNRVRIEQHGGLGVVWLGGWLFTIGFLGFGFRQGFLALFFWPYFLGAHFAQPQTPPAATAQEQPAMQETAPRDPAAVTPP